MLSVRDAENIIFDLVQPLTTQIDKDIEIVDLFNANGRILADSVVSNLDFPHWDNSAMDGYAVRYADVQECSQDKPVTLQIVEDIPAGYQPQITIQPGQAARIFTGAVMPQGADTIVMQENTRREEDRVAILTAPKPEEFVRKRANYYQAGNSLLAAGIELKAAEIAILAAAQCPQIKVYRKLKVAILSSGDELVTPNQSLQPGQIVDSNQYALAALVQQMGAEPLMLGIIKDEPEALREAISNAINNADIVLSSGGVSVGDYDYVEQIIESLGGEIHIRSVAVKPGKPLTVATFPHTLYFGLPGNPGSALVTFWRFVKPAIQKFSGLAEGWKPEFLQAESLHDLRSNGKRETYIWGNLKVNNGAYQFQVAGGSQSSSNLINLAQTNALAVIPVGQKSISRREKVQVLLL
ncbi:molybdopterin molybdotransferase MoeA [Mastigocoleus testarum]|uniref:Molybdopterin molybdenumtransferase n=1 Tax=Mastigocoleus testarum BC008 TaxID=371196 RepID=A0A0V7ZIC0_9CYAN|nr:gephyrin-like molybdotransferase Glp [Mastigocoleus testarum]KST62268.1 molybdopterin molybdenumtransferase [Mastigocoleus testarum BC008]KST64135.1 molybdopterin molybdenumtransferase [Mastigocoleus testarum BC008]